MRLSPLSQVRSAITGKNRFPVTIRAIQASLYRVESLVTPSAVATVGREVCLAQTKGQGAPIQLTIP
jgi:hypothetical protein